MAFIFGLGTVVTAVVGFQAWLDSRVDNHIDPVEEQVEELENRVDEQSEILQQRYSEISTNQAEILRYLRSRNGAYGGESGRQDPLDEGED